MLAGTLGLAPPLPKTKCRGILCPFWRSFTPWDLGDKGRADTKLAKHGCCLWSGDRAR